METAIRVLHVDDDPSFGTLTAEFLEREGDVIVETVSRASDALEYLAENEIDCVVSDYEMPETDGIELLEAVRERYPDLPFILFTGRGSEEIASEAISAGVTDYLQKETGTDQYAILANRIRNLVDRYRAERAVEESRRQLDRTRGRLSVALNAAAAGVWEWDVRTDEVIWDESLERMLGLEVGSFEGTYRAFLDRVHDDDCDALEAALQRAVARNEKFNHEFRFVDESGDVVWTSGRARLYTDGNGEPDRMIGVDIDVTDRKARERELERQNERLSEFTSVVTHELPQPLHRAIERVEVAQCDCDSDELTDAERALDRLSVLVDDLLALARQGEQVTAPTRSR